MKETTVEQFSQNVSKLLDESQAERIMVTRDGKPFAIVVGVVNKDEEDLRLEASPEFWRMIEKRRRCPSVRLADAQAALFCQESR